MAYKLESRPRHHAPTEEPANEPRHAAISFVSWPQNKIQVEKKNTGASFQIMGPLSWIAFAYGPIEMQDVTHRPVSGIGQHQHICIYPQVEKSSQSNVAFNLSKKIKC